MLIPFQFPYLFRTTLPVHLTALILSAKRRDWILRAVASQNDAGGCDTDAARPHMTARESNTTKAEKTDGQNERAAPIEEVTARIPDAGIAAVERTVQREPGTDVRCVPVREPSTPTDVSISFTTGDGSSVWLHLPGDDAHALIDAIQYALDVEPFEEEE